MRLAVTPGKFLTAALIILITGITGCGAAKDAQQRRNLMIPRKDELPRNKKYTSVEKRKTYKIKKNKTKRSKKLYN